MQKLGAEGGAVVDVELSRKSPLCKRLFQGVEVGGKPLREIEFGVRDESRHVVDEGEEVGLPHLAFIKHPRPMKGVGLPHVVRQFRFEPPPVNGRRLLLETMELEEATHRRVAYPLRYDPPLFRLRHEKGKGNLRQVLPEGKESGRRFFIERPRFAFIAPLVGYETFQLSSAPLIDAEPGKNGRSADVGPSRAGDIPLARYLLLEEPLFSPRLSFLPTRSAMMPNRKTAMAFFASSSMTNLLVVAFSVWYQTTGGISPQEAGREPLTKGERHRRRTKNRVL